VRIAGREMNIHQLARDLERVGTSPEADALIKIIRDAVRLLCEDHQKGEVNFHRLARELQRVDTSPEAAALARIIQDAANLLRAEIQHVASTRKAEQKPPSGHGPRRRSASVGAPPMPSSQEIDMHNKLIVERIFELQRAVRTKNDATALALQRAIIPLLEYRKPLASITTEALLALDGVGPKAVDLIQRVIAGETVDAIAVSVPTIVRKAEGAPSSRTAPDRGNWDGSWDNSVRAVEGE